jgi:hypothetical protein
MVINLTSQPTTSYLETEPGFLVAKEKDPTDFWDIIDLMVNA